MLQTATHIIEPAGDPAVQAALSQSTQVLLPVIIFLAHVGVVVVVEGREQRAVLNAFRLEDAQPRDQREDWAEPRVDGIALDDELLRSQSGVMLPLVESQLEVPREPVEVEGL